MPFNSVQQKVTPPPPAASKPPRAAGSTFGLINFKLAFRLAVIKVFLGERAKGRRPLLPFPNPRTPNFYGRTGFQPIQTRARCPCYRGKGGGAGNLRGGGIKPHPLSVRKTATNALWGMGTAPTCFIRFFPSRWRSSSLRFRVMSPP
jgi:hypothetical protein